MTVAFDTAGGQRQGVGHLLRSIALADELRAMNAEVRLVSQLKSLPPLVKHAMRASGLHAARPDLDSPGVVVVDRPDTTLAQLRRLHRQWPTSALVALDYYGPSLDGLGLVVNLNEARERVRARYSAAHYQGLQFAVVRDSFRRLRRARRRAPARVRQILIGFGGTDATGWSWQAVEALAKWAPEDLSIHLLLGAHPKTRRGAPSPSKVRHHVMVSDPAALLASSDLAVIGGGTMLIEAACLGVPAVVVPRTREESLFARQFVRAGAACVVQSNGAFPADAVRQHVRRLIHDREARSRMQHAGRRLIDGRGAARVARLVLRIAGEAN